MKFINLYSAYLWRMYIDEKTILTPFNPSHYKIHLNAG